MADKRYLRSTINLYANLGAVAPIPNGYVLLELYINGSSTPLYVVRKNSVEQPNGNIEIYEASFEVGELFSDYIDIEFDGNYTNQSLQCQALIKFFFSDNTEYTAARATFDFYGVDGYTYFQEGTQIVTGTPPAITTRTLYVPENTEGYVPTFSATGFNYNYFSATATTKTVSGVTWKIIRECTPKYEPYKITFVNRYGALEDIWFTLVRRNSSQAKSEVFKRNIVKADGTYDTYQHQTKTFNHTGTDSFVMNTPYVDETFNDTYQELLLSKKIWITENGQVLPVTLETKSLDLKQHVVDRLIQYEIGFKYAFDKINKVR